MNRPALLRTGSVILVVSAAGLLFATLGILSPAPDLDSKTGRHLMAGGLANAALAVVLILIGANSIKRGERWGLVAYVATLAIYGIPILTIDATHVAPSRLVRTLAPQVAGMSIMALGIAITAFALFAAEKRSESPD